jgi:hypothetical protein
MLGKLPLLFPFNLPATTFFYFYACLISRRWVRIPELFSRSERAYREPDRSDQLPTGFSDGLVIINNRNKRGIGHPSKITAIATALNYTLVLVGGERSVRTQLRLVSANSLDSCRIAQERVPAVRFAHEKGTSSAIAPKMTKSIAFCFQEVASNCISKD